jgi:hypothetical protein
MGYDGTFDSTFATVVLVTPFVFGITGGYQTSLVATGVVVAVLAAWRAVQPDSRVPLPFFPLVVILFGLYTIGSPLLFGSGLDSHGITLALSGVVFVVMPAMMLDQMLDEQSQDAVGLATHHDSTVTSCPTAGRRPDTDDGPLRRPTRRRELVFTDERPVLETASRARSCTV